MSDTESALMQEILASPDTAAPRRVLADWLTERGDPRGAFIHLQCDLSETPITDARWWELSQREEFFLQDQGLRWVKQLPKVGKAAWGIEPAYSVRRDWFERGVVERATFSSLAEFERSFEAMWEVTPVRHIRLNRWADKALPVVAEPKHMERLRGLWLTWDGFDPECERVPPFFQQMPLQGIERMRLFDRMLLPSGIEALLAADLDSLRRLEIDAYSPTEDYLPDLAAWPRLQQLTHLTYDRYGATDTGVQALAKAIPGAALEMLSLRGNELTSLAATALAESSGLDALGHLNLGGNAIDAKGVKSLAQSPWASQLRRLDLDENPLGEPGAAALTEGSGWTGLHFLNLAESNLGDQALARLTASQAFPELRGIDLSINPVGEEALVAFVLSPQLPELSYVCCRTNQLSAKGKKRIQERLPTARKKDEVLEFHRLD